MLSTLAKIFSRGHIKIFFSENRFYFFRQFAGNVKFCFLEKKKQKKKNNNNKKKKTKKKKTTNKQKNKQTKNTILETICLKCQIMFSVKLRKICHLL